MTRKVTYSMSASLDGYIVGPDGRFDWSAPDQDVFAHLDLLQDDYRWRYLQRVRSAWSRRGTP